MPAKKASEPESLPPPEPGSWTMTQADPLESTSKMKQGRHGSSGTDPFGDWSLPPGEDPDSLPLVAIDSDPPDLEEIAGRYQVVSVLGSGATSTVYEVIDTTDDSRHALKLLDLDDATEITRFQREQTLLRELDHPNVVRVTDSGTWEGRQYMVMTLLTGGSLLDWLRDHKGSMEYGRACRLFRGAAEALHAAHKAGVVHRDVKPGNLVLEPGKDGREERLLVLDFGIAKTVNSSSSLTDVGMVMGSPAYMCPERLFSGARATPSWDVYSLGVVMYEIITGVPLFRGNGWMDVMMKIQKTTPPFLSTVRSDAPPAFDWLISEMLSKEAPQRPSGCDVVARRLERLERQFSQ